MSNQPERPWTEEEKYTLLTEILKKSGIPSTYLVNIINSFRISPSWADIPLPPGRSLNSCKRAFTSMCQQQIQPLTTPVLFSEPRHEPVIQVEHPESSSSRKRPLRPLRAIQPRPPASTTGYSSESGVSPGLEDATARTEQPRKRGRPNKAEAERRKAAAQARGEVYPPPRRSGIERSKVSSTPTSPPLVSSVGVSYSPHVDVQMEARHSVTYPDAPRKRITALVGTESTQRQRSMSENDSTRQLPRPPRLEQRLPSPHVLQLGQRELIHRTSIGERGLLNPPLSELLPSDDGRRTLITPINERAEQPPISNPKVTLSERSADKRLG